jgi:NitT/TauT family transport system permease protein/taurine transport system permease protein
VLKTFVKLIESGELGLNLTASLVRLAIGLSLAVGTGIPFGVLMGTSKVLSDFFTPLLRLFVGISGIAWIPLITLWLGYGPMVCIFIIWNSVFFAIVYNTMLGVRSMPRDLLRVSRSLGAGPLRIFGEVLLPGSLPAIMNGLRSGLGYGWRGLIAAEMIATNAGLGYSIFLAQKYYDTAQIVLTMIILGSLWLILDRLVFAPLERRTIQRWGVIQKA